MFEGGYALKIKYVKTPFNTDLPGLPLWSKDVSL